MTQFSQNNSKALSFKPFEQDNISLQYYLDKAIHINHLNFQDSNFIYMMDVRHLNDKYGSLIIDSSGTFLKSEWSTSRLTTQLFATYGYNYDQWSKFLKQTYQRPRTIFPYVNESNIYLRLQQPNRKHADWLNLTYLKSMETQTDSFNFVFELNLLKQPDTLTIGCNQLLKQILTQIAFAFQLVHFWHDYQANVPAKSIIHESPSLYSYIGNPAFKLFRQGPIQANMRLTQKLDLTNFVKYNKIQKYISQASEKQAQAIAKIARAKE